MQHNVTTEDEVKVRNVVERFLNFRRPCDRLTVERMKGGLMNEVYCCSIYGSNSSTKFIVRFNGRDEATRGHSLIGESCEALVAYILGQTKLGPTVYGVFPGGRIDEYIPSTRITGDQMRRREFSDVIARKLANLHTLDIPVRKSPSLLETVLGNLLEERMLHWPPSEARDRRLKSMEFNVADEATRLLEQLRRIRSPMKFCQFDLNRDNILIRKNITGDRLTDKDLVIIDYEFCGYSQRSYDFATLFAHWMTTHSNSEPPNFRVDGSYPTASEKRHFVRVYLAEWKRITGTLNEFDVEDRILTEIEFFAQIFHVNLLLFGLRRIDDKTTFGYEKFIDHHEKQFVQMKEKFAINSNWEIIF